MYYWFCTSPSPQLPLVVTFEKERVYSLPANSIIIYTRLCCLLLQDKNGQRPDAIAISHEARALLRDARCTVQEDTIGDNASRVRPHTRWKQQYQQQYQDESSSNPSWLLHRTDTAAVRCRCGEVRCDSSVRCSSHDGLLLLSS